MVHRGADFTRSRKYWIQPNLENRVKEGSIRAVFHARVIEITHDRVVAERAAPGEPAERLPHAQAAMAHLVIMIMRQLIAGC